MLRMNLRRLLEELTGLQVPEEREMTGKMTSGEVLVDLTVLVAADATAIDMNGGMIGAAVVTEEMIEALIAVMIEAMIGTAGTIAVLTVIVGTIEVMTVIAGTIVVMIAEMIVVASEMRGEMIVEVIIEIIVVAMNAEMMIVGMTGIMTVGMIVIVGILTARMTVNLSVVMVSAM